MGRSFPYPYLACSLATLFSIFPFIEPALILVPCWVVPLVAVGRWRAALASALAVLAPSLLGELGGMEVVSPWIFDFSLAAGVVAVGWSGVLFGPVLVCCAKLLLDLGSASIRQHTSGRSPGRSATPPTGRPADGGTPASGGRRAASPAPRRRAPRSRR